MRKILSIVGPTASGKSDLAYTLASRLPQLLGSRGVAACEIVSCDSVQMVQGFDIGSAKPDSSERARFKHHFIDWKPAQESINAYDYAEKAREVIHALPDATLAIIVGGSGLYYKALVENHLQPVSNPENRKPQMPDQILPVDWMDLPGPQQFALLEKIDPERAKKLHPNDSYRVRRALTLFQETGALPSQLAPIPQQVFNLFTINLNPPRPLLHERINLRCKKMLEEGLIEEVKKLKKSGVDDIHSAMSSIGYKQVWDFLENNQSDIEALTLSIQAATRQYAKRQITWFKKMPASLVLTEYPYPVDAVLTKIEAFFAQEK